MAVSLFSGFLTTAWLPLDRDHDAGGILRDDLTENHYSSCRERLGCWPHPVHVPNEEAARRPRAAIDARARLSLDVTHRERPGDLVADPQRV